MPLILFTGFPSSGKTSYARELQKLLQEKVNSDPALSSYSVIYHSDATLGIKHSDYTSSHSEKCARSKIISVVKRDLSRTNILIIDSLNYIKGFRYQLHCEVKNISTTYCVVHCLAARDKIAEWNAQREDNWDVNLLQELIQRYEEPNPATRWDSPLFSVISGEDKLQDVVNADGMLKALFPQLYRERVDRDAEKILQGLKPSNATILKPAAQANLVQVLDSETQTVVRQIMEHLRSNVVSGHVRVIVSACKDINHPDCHYVELPNDKISMAQLQRIRRQFVQMNRLRNMEKDRIVPLFTAYLNANLENGL
ncbi:Kti12p Ecym_7408 [Eremothecium cymbalariae DBVPG|uniref:Protein KTI12 n=1 Tax=Eremothecium cymbalariae (strain CBS 270.75 / DBVPG 7215 / KCTC 17166 / NRRL Y-17582) TaxID=931890 RepID=G8JWL9_ERECY|nr:hypothetical protein Ecym_7408 [Eremothecium cymbalariae DBVPG\